MTMDNWFACELHCHTYHSDGDFTVNTLLKTAKERLLDGICLTDHNTISGWYEVEKNFTPVVLKGMELTTYYGHMLTLGIDEYVEWRDALPDNIDEKMKFVHSHSGLVGMAHPFQAGTPICTGGHWDYNVSDYKLVNYLEVWSEGNPFMNSANVKAYKLWVSLLDKGFKITPTFGRDWHNSENDIYPCACTYLNCDSNQLTPIKMKNAIKNGKTTVSAGPLFYFKTVDNRVIFTTDFKRCKKFKNAPVFEPKIIKLLTNNNTVLAEIPFSSNAVLSNINFEFNHYYRAELYGAINENENCLIAFTAPVYY